MNPNIMLIWTVTIALEGFLVIQVARKLYRAYPVLLLYIVADLMYETVMLLIALSGRPAALDTYTALWAVFEVFLAAAQIFVCYEAIRKVRSYIPQVLFGVSMASVLVATVVYKIMADPQHYDSGLEPAVTVKALIDLTLFGVLMGLAIVPRDRRLGQKIPIRYALTLSGYFGAMAIVNFLSLHQMSVFGRITPIPQALTTAIPGTCFLILLILFWRVPSKANV